MNKKNLTLLALALAMSGLAVAKDLAVKSDSTKDGISVAPPAATGNATKADNRGTKGNVSAQTGKEGAKDPYAVPLLKDARPLHGAH